MPPVPRIGVPCPSPRKSEAAWIVECDALAKRAEEAERERDEAVAKLKSAYDDARALLKEIPGPCTLDAD